MVLFLFLFEIVLSDSPMPVLFTLATYPTVLLLVDLVNAGVDLPRLVAAGLCLLQPVAVHLFCWLCDRALARRSTQL